MGRRSINTTKSGKYMNPTDQARKEARKKELKKNKKQRQMVRAAVLRGKDPQQLLLDLEKIDQMEYNVMQPSPLNEKVLKDKRKKLKDTLERVLKMYHKDDPDKWADLKRLQIEYERKRSALYNYYEAVKNAQQVQVDDIPLPIAALPAELQAVFVGIPSQIPLPAHAPPHSAVRSGTTLPSSQFLQPPQGILKKTSAYQGKEMEQKKEPPGVPVGPPPELEEEEEDDPMEGVTREQSLIHASRKTIRFLDDKVMLGMEDSQESRDVHMLDRSTIEDEDRLEEKKDEKSEEDAPKPRPTSLQQKMLAMAGQDIDQFMKEMEEVHKKRKADRAADLESRLQALEQKSYEGKSTRESSPIGATGAPGSSQNNVAETDSLTVPTAPVHRPGVNMMSGMPPLMFRPPLPRGVPALMGIRLPPGPPPGLPPRLGIRLPPGPPPGMPPRLMRPPNVPPVPPHAPAQTNVLTAAPQLINRPAEKPGATIHAEAQIRNLSADVTRFLPTALRVKRDHKQKKEIKIPHLPEIKQDISQQPLKNVQTKDDAYMQFMREMEGLL
ncbi:hypothetical protein RUM44_005591 [Polyplax serrata]|uniref:Wbp11/ELF5/Saf1 N-terminal domain-containing protein n=1 Tax=Polyplax serrata TaxID=468196 RepID=A0ABR1ADU4_POLSC